MLDSAGWRTRAVLTCVRIAADGGSLDRLHRAIEVEIFRGSQRLAKAQEDGNADGFESLVDDECDDVEELLGMAFAACQSFVTRVRGRISLLNEVCTQDFSRFAIKPDAVLTLGSRHGCDSFSSVEAIWEVANFWKHSEEWHTRENEVEGRFVRVWDTNPKNAWTVEVVTTMGLTPGSTGSLRTAARNLD